MIVIELDSDINRSNNVAKIELNYDYAIVFIKAAK